MKDTDKLLEMVHAFGIEYHYESDRSVLVKIVYAIYRRLAAKGLLA